MQQVWYCTLGARQTLLLIVGVSDLRKLTKRFPGNICLYSTVNRNTMDIYVYFTNPLKKII